MAQDAEKEFADNRNVKNRYDFYRNQTKFFRRLSGFLTEKRGILDDLMKRWGEFQRQYQSHVLAANQCYLRDDLAFLTELDAIESITAGIPSAVEMGKLREMTGPFFEGELFYDEQIAQTRSQQRCMYIDGPAVIRDSVREVQNDGVAMHVITAGVDVYLNNAIFVNYDEPGASQWEACIGAKIVGFLTLRVGAARSEGRFFRGRPGEHGGGKDSGAFRRVEEGVSFRVIVETEVPCSYEDAYAALAAPDFLIPAVLPSLFWFDPLGVEEGDDMHQRVEEFPWYGQIRQYGETVETENGFELELPASRPRASPADRREGGASPFPRFSDGTVSRRESWNSRGIRCRSARRRRCRARCGRWRGCLRR